MVPGSPEQKIFFSEFYYLYSRGFYAKIHLQPDIPIRVRPKQKAGKSSDSPQWNFLHIMKIEFPYQDVEPLEITPDYKLTVLAPCDYQRDISGPACVQQALHNPIGSPRLSVIAAAKKKVLLVFDDIARPTPVHSFIEYILTELKIAGIEDKQIAFVAALGSHRPMTTGEMTLKLGESIVKKYKIHNHGWDDENQLEYLGDTDDGVPVWINKLVARSDLVIGIGTIMPIEICGFTGGGKILVPGLCGEKTNSEMHWKKVDLPSELTLGRRDNPVRNSIDSLAKKAGLDFIVNVIYNDKGILGAVAGDMVEAHRQGCKIAADVFSVEVPKEFDIVIVDSFPFDIEFWQANKALDTAGEFVKKDGVVILVSPCYEGFSQTHSEMLEFGYLPTPEIKKLVADGKIKHKVVAVHMIQVGTVAVEKAKLILVSSGISKEQAENVGFRWAKTPQNAFDIALEIVGDNPAIAVLKDAARILPVKK